MPSGTKSSSRLRPLRVALVLHEPRQLGAGIAVARLIPYLSALGWSVTAWVPGHGPLRDVLRASGAEVVDAPPRPYAFSVSRFKAGEGRSLRAIMNYQRLFAQFLSDLQPHLVHANTFLTLPEALVARRRRIPLVLHVHELPTPGAKTSLAIRVARHVSSAIIAVGPEVAALLSPPIPGARVHVVENGIDVDALPRSARTGAGLHVGTVGSVSRRKGTDVFLEIVARISRERHDTHFHHVGDWDSETDRDFIRRASSRADELAARGSLTVHGVVGSPRELVADWDVFVLLSRQDPYPLALLEAMAASVPVVVTDVGGIRHIVGDDHAGIVVPTESLEATAEAIQGLLSDQALRTSIGQAGYERVRARNSLVSQADKVSSVYLRALTREWGPRHLQQPSFVR